MDWNALDQFLRTETREEQNRIDYSPLFEKYAKLPASYQEIKRSNISLDMLKSLGIEDTHFITYSKMLPDYPYPDGIQVIKQNRYTPVVSHAHDWLELAYMYSGTCTITFKDTCINLQVGQALLINAGTDHSNGICGEKDILVNFLIRRDYLNTNFFHRFSAESPLSKLFMQLMSSQSQTKPYIFFQSESSRRLPVFVNEFLCEYFEKSNNAQDYLDSYTSLIFLELIDSFKDGQTTQLTKQQQTLYEVLRYMEDNFKDCTLKSVAEAFNMNSNYLSNSIKKHTGQTYKSIIQDIRLNLAVKLLKNTAHTVTEISYQCGYENVSFFYKKFRLKYACTPDEYRKP